MLISNFFLFIYTFFLSTNPKFKLIIEIHISIPHNFINHTFLDISLNIHFKKYRNKNGTATKLVIGTFEGEIILIDFENSTTQKILVVNIIQKSNL